MASIPSPPSPTPSSSSLISQNIKCLASSTQPSTLKDIGPLMRSVSFGGAVFGDIIARRSSLRALSAGAPGGGG